MQEDLKKPEGPIKTGCAILKKEKRKSNLFAKIKETIKQEDNRINGVRRKNKL